MIFKWLYQKVYSWDDIIYKDILDHLLDAIVMWIEQNDFELIVEREIFNAAFYIFVYSNKTTLINDEYYELKYMEDMVDLFLNLKDITKSYGSQLFHEKNRTSNDLFHFLFSYIEEFEYIEEEDSNDVIFYEVD